MSRDRTTTWPAPDREMWEALTAPGGFLVEPGPLGKARDSTLERLAQSYSAWLTWLGDDEPAALMETPTSRPTLARVSRWMDALADRSPYTRLMRIDALRRLIGAAEPGIPRPDLGRLRAIIHDQAASTRSTRKDGRILSGKVVLAAGRAIFERGADRDVEHAAACAIRDGALIALLACLPLRARTLSELELSTSILREGTQVRIVASRDMLKRGGPWEALVPESVAAMLLRYIDAARPVLAAVSGTASPRLWLTNHGKPYTAHYISNRVAILMERELGARISAHFFRDIAATTLEREAPQAARLIRPLLGHAGFATAEEHYIHATAIDAGRRHAAVIEQLLGGKKGAK